MCSWGYPGGTSGKEPASNSGDIKDTSLIHGWENPLEEAWQPILVFLPGESHGQRSLAGYNPQVLTESDTTEVT